MNIEIMKEAIWNRFQIKREKVAVFISPDESSAIVLTEPSLAKEVATDLSICKCNNGWPFKEPFVPNQRYLQGGFQLYRECFPGAFLDPRFVKIRIWDFVEENWRL